MPKTQPCRKCGGRMFPAEDVYSQYFTCLQCGAAQEMARHGSLDETLAATLAPLRAKLGLAATRA